MKVTLKQLSVFTEVVKNNSISVGAEKCFISQSAASMSLSQLESVLDITLFDRGSRSLKINSDGQKIFDSAILILEKVKELESYNKNSESELSGEIVIGSSTTITNFVLPKYISKFKSVHQNVNFKIIDGNTNKIINLVETFNCDIGFIEGECNSHLIDANLWKKDELCIVSSIDNPLTKKKKISVADILKYKWVMRESGSGTREIFVKNFNEKSIEIDLELTSSNAIKQYIPYSNSLACLSHFVIDNVSVSSGLAKLQIEGLNLNRNFYYIFNKKKYKTKLINHFSEWLIQESQNN
jgi:DNA-binding transcriptional LysR family regulator